MLIDLCERNGLIFTNTWFKKPKRRLYTWKAPGDWSRHRLNYILVKHRFRNSVKDVQTLPGAYTDSDHNLLVVKVRTRLKKIIRFQKSRPRWDLQKLYAERQRVQNILDSQGNRIVDQKQVLKIWENYVTELYDRPNRAETLEVEPEEVDANEKGPYILQYEMEKAIKEMRNKKATGDDDVPGDVLKLLGEGGLKILTKLINTIYETGQ